MTEPTSEARPPDSNGYEQQLGVFAEQLRYLHIACGKPSLREVKKKASSSRPLSTAAVSEALAGKRLPSVDFLMELVQTLLAFEDGRPVSKDDARVKQWRSRWVEVQQAKDRFRSSARSEGGNGHLARPSSPSDASALQPPVSGPSGSDGPEVDAAPDAAASELVRERDGLAERVAVLEAAAAAAARAPDSVVAEIESLLQQAADRRGRGVLDQAEQGYWSALDLAIQYRARWEQGRAWDGLGSCRWRGGDHETALAYFTRADRVADEVDDFWLKAWCLYNFGVYWRRAHAPTAAKEFFEQALTVADAHSCYPAAGWTHHEMAELAREQEDPEREREHFAQAAQIGLDSGDGSLAGQSLVLLARCAERGGDLRQAGEHYARALDIGTRGHHQDVIRKAKEGLGRIGL